MSKADRILSRFPSYYRAADRTKLLAKVVEALAQPLEEAEKHLFRIQRAHRLLVAEQPGDIVRLAAALNLTAFHFEDLMADAEDLEQRLAMMRERVQRIARLHLRGAGTAWAVLEAAAIFLNARIVADNPGEPLIKHIDPEGFSHRATIEFGFHPERPRAQLYLHENPFRRQKVQPAERWQLDSWAVENQTVETAPAIVVIRGVGDRTVLPSIFSAEQQEGLVFNGIVPDGKTLVIDAAGGARLDGRPVDDWLIHFRGGIADFSPVGASTFVTERGRDAAPFDGNLERLVSPPYRVRKLVPAARRGRSTWTFKVAEGVWDGSLVDFAVYAPPAEPIGLYDGDNGFDGAVFDYPASGVVGMAWDERIPCTFKLVLPAHVPSAQASAGEGASAGDTSPVNYLGRVGSILPRFKAAGVRGFVDTVKDAWVLGQSVIRSPDAADGEGVAFNATRLQWQHADSFVPLDPVVQ